jgi:hypothetical protein
MNKLYSLIMSVKSKQYAATLDPDYKEIRMKVRARRSRQGSQRKSLFRRVQVHMELPKDLGSNRSLFLKKTDENIAGFKEGTPIPNRKKQPFLQGLF